MWLVSWEWGFPRFHLDVPAVAPADKLPHPPAVAPADAAGSPQLNDVGFLLLSSYTAISFRELLLTDMANAYDIVP